MVDWFSYQKSLTAGEKEVLEYKILRFLITSFLVTYFLAGLYVFRFEGGEKYPFFSWNLFTEAPREKTEFILRIQRYGDVVFEEPIDHKEAFKRGLIRGFETPLVFHLRVQDLGRSIKAGNRDRMSFYRMLVEDGFKEQPVEYEILSIYYHTLEYFRSGRIQNQDSLGVFTSK